MRTPRMRNLGHALVVAGVAILMTVLAIPAIAATTTVTYTISDDTVVRGNEGDVFVVGVFDVPADLVGSTCTANATTLNNTSVHKGNDALITSAGGLVTIPDVEKGPHVTTPGSGTVDLGSTVSIAIRLGPPDRPDRPSVFSGGIEVTLTCEVPPPDTTTTTTGPPDTTQPPTTEPPTTEPPTTEPPTTEPPTTEPPTTEPPTTEPPTTEPPTTEPPESGKCVEVDTDGDGVGDSWQMVGGDDDGLECFPVTGADLGDLAIGGLVTLAAGAFLVLRTPKPDVARLT